MTETIWRRLGFIVISVAFAVLADNQPLLTFLVCTGLVLIWTFVVHLVMYDPKVGKVGRSSKSHNEKT